MLDDETVQLVEQVASATEREVGVDSILSASRRSCSSWATAAGERLPAEARRAPCRATAPGRSWRSSAAPTGSASRALRRGAPLNAVRSSDPALDVEHVAGRSVRRHNRALPPAPCASPATYTCSASGRSPRDRPRGHRSSRSVGTTRLAFRGSSAYQPAAARPAQHESARVLPRRPRAVEGDSLISSPVWRPFRRNDTSAGDLAQSIRQEVKGDDAENICSLAAALRDPRSSITLSSASGASSNSKQFEARFQTSDGVGVRRTGSPISASSS